MTVTREMISAAHAEAMKGGDVILSAELITRIYEAMAARAGDPRERYAKLCDEWARICDSGRRHGAKVGAQECAKLIRGDAQHA